MKDRVLIVSENISGHRLSYVRLLTDHALAMGMRVTLALPEAAPGSETFQVHLAAIRDAIDVVSPSNFGVPALNALAVSLGVSKTIVPDGDRLLYEIARKGGWTRGQLSLLIMRPGGQSHGTLVRHLQSAVKAALRMVARQRKGVRPVVLVSAITWDGSTRRAPDPVRLVCTSSDVSQTRDAWPDGERYWFGVVGALDGRKNIRLVASALATLEGRKVGLVLAGRGDVTDAHRELARLREIGVPVVRRDVLLSDLELDSIVAALDCVILAHSNEGPSGIFGKALASGTRIVTAGADSLRRDAALRPEAAAWTPLAEQPLREALATATRSERPAPEPLTEDDFCRVIFASE